MESDELLECLHCGHKWKPNRLSNGFPKQCPNHKCHSLHWAEYPIRDRYTQDNISIKISDKVYENLYRFKLFPSESFARVIDRLMLDCTPSLTITYRSKPKPHHINISIDSKLKLVEIKNYRNWKSLDEALWRVMNNDTNRKL